MATPEKYYDYINSEKWAQKSKKIIESIGNCEKCNSHDNLQCHHLKYQNIGNETKEDIKVLCENCHEKEHKHDDYKKKLCSRFVGGQDISIVELRNQEIEIRKNYSEEFLENHSHRRNRVNWKPKGCELKEE